MKEITVASSLYKPEKLNCFADYEKKIFNLVTEDVSEGANVLLFPEYASCELSSIADTKFSIKDELSFIQQFHEPFLELFSKLAIENNILIISPSFLLRVQEEKFVNRAYLLMPSGELFHQDKIMLTQFEKDTGLIIPGSEMNFFKASWGSFGIAVCYDSEFPQLMGGLLNNAVELLFIPSCTDTKAGLNRVKIASRARAMEGQLFSVLSGVDGKSEFSNFIDINFGTASIYGPIEQAFYEDGILSENKLCQNWSVKKLNLQILKSIRERGQVKNLKDSQNLRLKINRIKINTISL
jgi:predicted amidohydrolase